MKTFIMILGVLFLIAAALSTPIAVVLGMYDWVINDVEFKYALWLGFKSWVAMILTGFGIGLPCFYIGKE